MFLSKGFLRVQSTISSSHYSILLYNPLQKNDEFFIENGQKSDDFQGNKELGWGFEKMACDVLGGGYCKPRFFENN